jgi:hypothetical protein
MMFLQCGWSYSRAGVSAMGTILNDVLRRLGLVPVPLSAATRERLTALFAKDDWNAAERRLSWFGTHLSGWPRDSVGLERVRFAVLKLSNGRLTDLQEWIDEARRNWIEVVGRAGFLDDANSHKMWRPDSVRGGDTGKED